MLKCEKSTARGHLASLDMAHSSVAARPCGHRRSLHAMIKSMFLAMVNAHSKRVEVIMVSSTTSERTITELRKFFAAHGLPEQLVFDNRPQFTSVEFDVFLKSNGVLHICSAPYHPQSNGEAERFVQTFRKTGLRERTYKAISIFVELSHNA